ncbi:hypothetical protein D9C73_007046 [Collichthys lucidus]|uniref:Uncharacterized protein n=1 Tax=Collichthys lucidus TaxID=240159 RepID=A0A4U5UES2_COLLU|nr:hypothetical protein D9C73_007046 [Collichthys lucidus]
MQAQTTVGERRGFIVMGKERVRYEVEGMAEVKQWWERMEEVRSVDCLEMVDGEQVSRRQVVKMMVDLSTGGSVVRDAASYPAAQLLFVTWLQKVCLTQIWFIPTDDVFRPSLWVIAQHTHHPTEDQYEDDDLTSDWTSSVHLNTIRVIGVL